MIVAQSLLAALAVFSAVLGALAWRNMARTPRLVEADPTLPDPAPSVSVVMAARDEAKRIGPAILSRLADGYPDVEYILVDDRSDDGTARIAREVAGDDARLKILRVEELPEGWLGKVNALRLGLQEGRGEWVAFSDADVSVERGMLARVVATCLREGLDCYTLVPEYRSHSVMVDALWTVFIRVLGLALDDRRVRDPSSKLAVGSGAFTIVRREILDRTPGFEHMRMETADDMALGAMAKEAGGRCSIGTAVGLASVRMYDHVGAFLRGVEKNGSTTGAHPVRWTFAILLFAVLDVSPVAALVTGIATASPWLILVGIATCVFTWVVNIVALYGSSRIWAPALVWPLGTVLFAYGVIRATWLARIRGGVWWRGTFYPLAELEAGRRFHL